MIAGIKKVLQASIEEEDALLRERADEIDTRLENKEMRDIISTLKRTMRKTGLVSLSAPAIGESKRIFCIKYDDEDIKTYINPIIVKATGLSLSKEICSSLEGRKFIRPRNNEIEIMYQTPLGAPESKQLLGMAAYVFQHEMDHLDGLLLDDIGLEVDEDFDNASEEERQEVIDYYLDSLDMATNKLNEEIQENPKLKQMDDAIKFMTSVYKGETILEPMKDEEPEENLDV